jgi:hypothetical protein
MSSRTLTILLLAGIGLGILALFPKVQAFNLPGNNEGYEPVQPIAFSHRLHAGELGVQCLYCHSGAERSRHAGVPSAAVCMNCHRFVTTTFGAIRQEDELAAKEKRSPRRIVSPEIQKIYRAMALNSSIKPDPSQTKTPIEWVRVHNLPDFVYFEHRRHVNAGVACQNCHGAVETMERVVQATDLSMGWCVNCHRAATNSGINGKSAHASTDCGVCHY